jgi:hypothetical protein
MGDQNRSTWKEIVEGRESEKTMSKIEFTVRKSEKFEI